MCPLIFLLIAAVIAGIVIFVVRTSQTETPDGQAETPIKTVSDNIVHEVEVATGFDHR